MKKFFAILAALILIGAVAAAEDAVIKAFNDAGYPAFRVDNSLYLTINADPSLKVAELGNMDFGALGGSVDPDTYQEYISGLDTFYIFIIQGDKTTMCIEYIHPSQDGEATNVLISTDKVSELFGM